MHWEPLTIPLVLVEGFLSANSALSWGKFEQFLNPKSTEATDNGGRRPIFFTNVGPVSSLHDRACELFYELKGGRVDYGESHAHEFGHDRYGRDYPTGLYPAWSAQHPVHLLAHSMGGSTITKLIALLREGFFGEEAHPDMVLSVTTVSAPFRGTQIVYTLGEKVDAAPAVRTCSVGSFISRLVHTLAYLTPLLPRLPIDLHADARRLTCRQSSFTAFLGQLWHSDWAEGCDAAPYDCTFAAADAREARGEGVPNPRTWYQSYASVFTVARQDGPCHTLGLSSVFSPFYLVACLAGSFDFSALCPRPSWLPTHSRPTLSSDLERGASHQEGDGNDGHRMLGEEYWANDGVVPLFSQWHPFPCSAEHCIHVDTPAPAKLPAPGVWYVHRVPGAAHHLTLIPAWLGTQRQREFWTEVGVWLSQVETARYELLDYEKTAGCAR